MIGKPIFWQIPNDRKADDRCRASPGEPLHQHAPKSSVQQSFFGLAQALYGKPAAARAAKNGKQGRVAGSFSGRRLRPTGATSVAPSAIASETRRIRTPEDRTP